MKRSYGIGLISSAIFAFVAGSAEAQVTTANGPYYANPSWDQTLPPSTRFIVLSNMNSEAVLDRETGLVWQKSTSTIPGSSTTTNWISALNFCMTASTGNRLGWRLPTVQELASLIDPTTLNLPTGHPFNLLLTFYWTATTYAPIPGQAWTVRPGGFGASVFVPGPINSNNISFWCVRGGQGLDTQ